jgi:hypothetical protein
MKAFVYIKGQKLLRAVDWFAHEAWAVDGGKPFLARRFTFGSGKQRMFPGQEVDFVVAIKEDAVAVYVDMKLFVPGVGLHTETVEAIAKLLDTGLA